MKTYYAPEMQEWLLAVPCGKARVMFHFRGGWKSAHGSSPATFTTDNPAAIAILEGSTYFRRGEIRLAKESPEPGPPGHSGNSRPSGNFGNSGPSGKPGSSGKPEKPAPPVTPAPPPAKPHLDPLTMRDVHVACAEDAKDYLATHYGIDRASILTPYDLMDAAKRKNLRFLIGENANPLKFKQDDTG